MLRSIMIAVTMIFVASAASAATMTKEDWVIWGADAIKVKRNAIDGFQGYKNSICGNSRFSEEKKRACNAELDTIIGNPKRTSSWRSLVPRSTKTSTSHN